MNAESSPDAMSQRLEAVRLAALESLDILDTPAEEAFDRVARLAADLFDAPIALISLVDADRQWFKAKVGLQAAETARDISFCQHAIRGEEVMVVEDARVDSRFAENPLVLGDPHIRFYAGAPLRLPSGLKLGSLCVIDTQPRALDAVGRRQLAALAQIAVDEMELRLKTEQLDAARIAAERAAQVKGDFFANTSHELRTPLTAVIGFSGLLAASKDLSDRDRHFVDRIQTGSKTLLSLINDVLDMAKLDAGRTEVNLEPVDVSGFLSAILDQFQQQAADKRIGLNLELRPGAPVLADLDPQAVRQILLNLISNAVKFTDQGEVSVTAGPLSDGGLSISVSDTGVGIQADRLDSVFERFVQADSSISRKFGGTGLGLSSSRRLAELMGATLTVSSQAGSGSTFELRLPAARP